MVAVFFSEKHQNLSARPYSVTYQKAAIVISVAEMYFGQL